MNSPLCSCRPLRYPPPMPKAESSESKIKANGLMSTQPSNRRGSQGHHRNRPRGVLGRPPSFMELKSNTSSRFRSTPGTKMRLGPDGIHIFARGSGANLLVGEIVLPKSMWAAAPRQVSIALTNTSQEAERLHGVGNLGRARTIQQTDGARTFRGGFSRSFAWQFSNGYPFQMS